MTANHDVAYLENRHRVFDGRRNAARLGAGPLAVGNSAGTNVVNILLILGLSAAIAPIAIARNTIRFELPSWWQPLRS